MKNRFRYKDAQGREAEVAIAANDPTAIASFREFMSAIQDGQQQDWNNQMQSVAAWKTPAPQLALPQSQPLQLAPAQTIPAASFPRHPEPIYQPPPPTYDAYPDREVRPAYQQAQATHQPLPQVPQTASYQPMDTPQAATAPTSHQDLYQFDPLLDDREMIEIFDRPLWVRLLVNPLSIAILGSAVLGATAWIAIDSLKKPAPPTPAPAVQVAPASPTPVAPASPQPAPNPLPKTGNQIQAAPSTPPPLPNS